MSNEGHQVKEVRANRFVLEDEDGTDRAELSLNGGRLSIKLYSRNRIDNQDEGPINQRLFRPRPNLTLCNANDDELAKLCIDEDFFGVLLLDRNGTCRASLGIGAGKPWLTFFDEEGDQIWKAP